MSTETLVLGWHFVGDTLRDGRPVPGDEVLIHSGPIKLCESGLHAAIEPLDALRYAPGATLCRVGCGGDIEHGRDKLVCSRRQILWRLDATTVLRQFARRVALDVAHLWEMPPVVAEYLRTGDEKLRVKARAATRAAAGAAAWDAAWDAAGAAARAAARAAAGAAAWDAAWDAAGAAAGAAARDAAGAAARAAAWDAACDAAGAAAWDAAGAAARDAAWDAARAQQNEILLGLIREQL